MSVFIICADVQNPEFKSTRKTLRTRSDSLGKPAIDTLNSSMMEKTATDFKA